MRRCLTVMLAATAAATAPVAAHADVLGPDPYARDDWTRPFVPVSDRRYGLAMASIYLRYAHARDAPALARMSDLFVGGLSARAAYGKRVGYGFGLDLMLGASGRPGFAFGFDLLPLGVALPLGPTGLLGLFAGVGVGGVTARVPFTLTVPAELRLELDVARRARLGALFAVGWTPVASARRHGSLLVPFVDEMTMAITARFGKTFPRDGLNMGRGYFLRLERREQMRTILLGLSFGVEIDVAG